MNLDPADIAAHLPSARRRADATLDTLAEHLDQHGGYVSWSGGKDSTVAAHMVSRVRPETPVVFFNSGLEFPETIDYLEQAARDWSLNLVTIDATPDALTLMRSSGAWDHDAPINIDLPSLHDTLITTPARLARTMFGRAEVWGLRASESTGRRALLAPGKGATTRADGTHVYSPVWDWNDNAIHAYFARHQIAANPVYERLRSLGATGQDLRCGLMIDGNNLHHGRALWIKRGWPEQWERLVEALPRLAEWA